MKIFRRLALSGMAAAVAISLIFGNVVNVKANISGISTPGVYVAQSTVETGDTIANSTAETTFTSVARIAAGQMSVGRILQVVFGGIVSTTATPTIDLIAYTNPIAGTAGTPTAAYVKINDSAAVTMASGIATLDWTATLYITCVVAGASGKIETRGSYVIGGKTGTAAIGTATITAFDTTAANTVGLSVTWSAASTSNTIAQRMGFPFLGN